MSGKYYLGSQVIEHMDSENMSVGSLLQAERLAEFLDSSPFLHARIKLLGAEDSNNIHSHTNDKKDKNNEDDHSCDGTEADLLRCLHGLLSLLQASITRKRLADRVRLHGLAFCNKRSNDNSNTNDRHSSNDSGSMFALASSLGLECKIVSNADELIKHFESMQNKYHTY